MYFGKLWCLLRKKDFQLMVFIVFNEFKIVKQDFAFVNAQFLFFVNENGFVYVMLGLFFFLC